MPEIEAKMKLNKVTKNGKLRYGEVDEDGNFLGLGAAKIGTVYLAPDFFDGEQPEFITLKQTAVVL